MGVAVIRSSAIGGAVYANEAAPGVAGVTWEIGFVEVNTTVKINGIGKVKRACCRVLRRPKAPGHDTMTGTKAVSSSPLVSAMTIIPIQQAQANLATLIHELGPGDELVITEDNQPVARIVATSPQQPSRHLGKLAGTVLHMSPDFDTHLGLVEDY
jgi:antitoxin (DNA-binding transcriptional repressor) of toxin-antitoxin stability system